MGEAFSLTVFAQWDRGKFCSPLSLLTVLSLSVPTSTQCWQSAQCPWATIGVFSMFHFRADSVMNMSFMMEFTNSCNMSCKFPLCLSGGLQWTIPRALQQWLCEHNVKSTVPFKRRSKQQNPLRWVDSFPHSSACVSHRPCMLGEMMHAG